MAPFRARATTCPRWLLYRVSSRAPKFANGGDFFAAAAESTGLARRGAVSKSRGLGRRRPRHEYVAAGYFAFGEMAACVGQCQEALA